MTRVAVSKCPVIKFCRRSRKTGDSIGGSRKSKMLAVLKRKYRLVVLEGPLELFFSVLEGL